MAKGALTSGLLRPYQPPGLKVMGERTLFIHQRIWPMVFQNNSPFGHSQNI
jgi:hypothetical protein